MYDLLIIGSGPAGLSAAVYGKRAGLNLAVVEKNSMSGGQVLTTYEVDNYLGLPGINGFDMGVKFREHAENMGVEFIEATVTGVTHGENCKTVHTDQGDYEARALILATGADHARLGIPGEEELAGVGVSYCATCDGAFFRGRTVAVIGGGDVALEDAIYLARFCDKVYLIHRRDEFRGARILQEEIHNLSNIEIIYHHVAKKIEGSEVVEALHIEDVNTKESRRLPVDGVFVAVGIHPNTDLFGELVSCDEAGYILAGEDGSTDTEGVFVAGDLRKKPLRQIVTAVSDGANAAVSAGSYLNKFLKKS